MKLTEKILDCFFETVLQEDDYYLNRFEEISISVLGEKITWLMMEEQILENQENAEKHDKLIDDLNSRRESNIKQREIELNSESGSKAFAYQLEWGIDLISAILNYDFYKGRNHLEVEQENKQLKEDLDSMIKHKIMFEHSFSEANHEANNLKQKLAEIKESMKDDREGDCYKIEKIKKILDTIHSMENVKN